MASPVSPDAVADLLLWCKADAGVDLVGGFVSVWHDQSGLANDLPQAISGSRPLFVADAGDGLPEIRFDGVDDYLGPTVVLPAAGADNSVILTARIESGTHGVALITGFTSGGNWKENFQMDLGVIDQGTGSPVAATNFDFGADLDDGSDGGGALGNVSDYFVTYLIRRVDHTWSIRSDVVTSDATFTLSPGAVTGRELAIGTRAGDFTPFTPFQLFTGGIRHVLAYGRAITDLEWEGVLAFLKSPPGSSSVIRYKMVGRDVDCIPSTPVTWRTWTVSGTPDATGASYTGPKCGGSPLADIRVIDSWVSSS